MKISNKITNLLASFLLVLMLGLAFFSMLGDANTMDELAHTPAGYSYITQQDMRLNPEHPPLLKDLAGFSVWLGSKITQRPINFPDQDKSWQEEVNSQWNFGRKFLFQSNNPTDKIIFWARLPMLLIMLLLGFYVFKWTRELYGNKAGLLALFLYSLSPTFLAHGRLVTTDVGAAAAFFIATYYFLKWLQFRSPTPTFRSWTPKNLIIAGLVFGLALLTKFSLVLLIPYFIFLVITYAFLKSFEAIKKSYRFFTRSFIISLFKMSLLLLLIGLIAMALVWPIYQFHTWHYPPEKQQADTQFILETFGKRWLAQPIIWMSDKPILRAYAQFFLGVLMVIQRTAGGNTTFFLGEISNVAWPHYFPVVFLIKVPLALLILIIIALASITTRKPRTIMIIPKKTTGLLHYSFTMTKWLKAHFTEFALLSFFVIYWITSIKSNLNIGVRHVLPTFPILYLLISGQIIQWLKIPAGPILEKIKLTSDGVLKNIKMTFFIYLKTGLKYSLLIILLFWYAWGTIKIYPHFLTYFNELVGGPTNGYKYVTDSNLDWGQDLKRLTKFAEENNIKTIYLDYFGGDSPQYRLQEKFQPWWGDRDPNELPPHSWLAISATFLQGGRGITTKGYNQKTGYYNWLNQYEPVTVIGNSIFVYNIE
jgi:hypothetical protein